MTSLNPAWGSVIACCGDARRTCLNSEAKDGSVRCSWYICRLSCRPSIIYRVAVEDLVSDITVSVDIRTVRIRECCDSFGSVRTIFIAYSRLGTGTCKRFWGTYRFQVDCKGVFNRFARVLVQRSDDLVVNIQITVSVQHRSWWRRIR